MKRVYDMEKKTFCDKEDIYQMTEFFKVLSDPTRVKVLMEISKNEICVSSIADRLHVSESTVSHHLQMLKMCNLVKRRREGKAIFYSLSDEHVGLILAKAAEHISEK